MKASASAVLVGLLLFLTVTAYCEKPATELSLEEALASEYPLPLTMASDGIHLLRRVLTTDHHISLDFEDINTKGVIHLPVLDGEALRATLSPHGDLVAFYLQADARERSLYIWHPQSNILERMSTKSEAEGFVAWSSDESHLLTIDQKQGLVLTSVKSGETSSFSHETIRAASFTADGKAIAYVTGSSPHSIIIRSLAGVILQVLGLDKDVEVDELQWQPDSNNMAFVYDQGRKSGIGLVSLSHPQARFIFEGVHDSIREVTWMNDSVAFVSNNPGTLSSTIYVGNSLGGGTRAALTIPGIADIRGVSSTSGTLGYATRGQFPVRFDILNVRLHSHTFVARSPSALSTVEAHSVLLKGPSVECRAYLWNTHHPIAAIVRFHGKGADELPVWQSDIQFFMQRHVLYLTVGYDPLRVSDTHYQNELLTATLLFLHDNGIASDRVVLLGFSAGSDFLLHAIVNCNCTMRNVVLYGVNVAKTHDVFTNGWRGSTPLVFVYGTHDQFNTITSTLLSNFHSSTVRAIGVDDTHLLVHPRSWLEVQELLNASIP